MKILSNLLVKAGLAVDGQAVFNNTANGVTPDLTDNSTKFATTAWVKSQGYGGGISTAIWGQIQGSVADQTDLISYLSTSYYNKTQADARYLQSFTETDPVFNASVAAGITSTDITNWNTAYGWGDHSASGYLLATTAAAIYHPKENQRLSTTNDVEFNSVFSYGGVVALGNINGLYLYARGAGTMESGSLVMVRKSSFSIYGALGISQITSTDDSKFRFAYVTTGANYKEFDFSVSSLSVGSPVVLTIPNASGTIALTSDLSGFLTSYTETDPVWTSEKTNYYTKTEAGNAFQSKENQRLSTTDSVSFYTINVTSSLIAGQLVSGQYLVAEGSAGENGIVVIKRRTNAYGFYAANSSQITTTGLSKWHFDYLDASFNSKGFAFDVSGLTSNTLRTLTIPNASGTIALTSDLSGYLTSYTETDTLQSVTSRGNTTTNSITAAGLVLNTSSSEGYTLNVNGTAQINQGALFSDFGGQNITYSLLVKTGGTNDVLGVKNGAIVNNGAFATFLGSQPYYFYTNAGYYFTPSNSRFVSNLDWIYAGGTMYVAGGASNQNTGWVSVKPSFIYNGSPDAGTKYIGFYYSPSNYASLGSQHYSAVLEAGKVLLGDLAGAGTRMVVADSSGLLSTQEIPTGGGSIGELPARVVQSFTATVGQTTFTISGGYTVGLIDVFYNGSHLSASEFTATDGNTVVLTTAAYDTGDVIDVVSGTPYINVPVMPAGTNSNILIDCGTITAPNENLFIDCGVI